jgi:hypothetical protein
MESHAPWKAMHHGKPCTMENHVPWKTMYHGKPCSVENHVPLKPCRKVCHAQTNRITSDKKLVKSNERRAQPSFVLTQVVLTRVVLTISDKHLIRAWVKYVLKYVERSIRARTKILLRKKCNGKICLKIRLPEKFVTTIFRRTKVADVQNQAADLWPYAAIPHYLDFHYPMLGKSF